MEVIQSRPTQSKVLAGRWVTSQVYAATAGLAIQTLSNWRYRDRQAGRTGAAPGYPNYRRFGGAVRYWLDIEHGDTGRA